MCAAGEPTTRRRCSAACWNSSSAAATRRLDIALVQHGLGDDEQALASLEKAWQERAVDLERLSWDPLWKNLRTHPRDRAILKKMNLSERLHEDYH